MLTFGEQCDASLLDNKTCADFGFGGGALGCGENCTFNMAGCSPCGNAVINLAEQCDSTNLGGASCGSLGFAGGNLACSTCHVYVERGLDSLGEISDKENDIMDKAWAVRPESPPAT